MAILKVARLGHPVLREQARLLPRAEIVSAENQRLIDDMVETMREYDGAGLAANQVHTLKQVAVIEVKGDPRDPDTLGIPLMVMVNPLVTALTDELEDGWEGCLSVPDMRGLVPRFTAVRLQCFDRTGEPVDLVAKDFFARVIQHEVDHLDGVLFMDRVASIKTDPFPGKKYR